MLTRIRICVPVLGLLLLAVNIASAKELTVGSGKDFARVEQALAKAGNGDTINVYPNEGGAYEKVALYVTAKNLTIKACPARPGQRVVLSGKGFDYSGRGSIPRAIIQFNMEADGCTIEGFELRSAHNDSHNGAGVRINHANNVTVHDCHIHANDMGIMSNGDGTDRYGVNQRIEGCLIESNGDRSDPGYNHNLYLGGTSATLVACEVRGSLTGNNVKSRCHRTVVLGCYVHDSSNREFDLVDAKGDTTAPDSHAILLGNLIVKDPNCGGNRAVIHFGTDGGKEHDGTLFLLNNTIDTPFITPVVTLSAPKAKACIANNIIWDGGSRRSGQRLVEARAGQAEKGRVTGASNWISAGFAGGLEQWELAGTIVAPAGQSPPFSAAAAGDYRLSRPDKTFVGAGVKLETLLSPIKPPPFFQYKAPQSKEERTDADKPDLGAYQYRSAARQ